MKGRSRRTYIRSYAFCNNIIKTNIIPYMFFRHYMGEDLDSLSLKELHNLEHQLDSALKQIRSRKVIQYLLSYTIK